jgi:cytochrome c553
MRFLETLLLASASFVALVPTSAAGAADPAQVEAALKQDAVCTRCHDETETRPVLSIYQTRHGDLPGMPRPERAAPEGPGGRR